MTKDFDNYLYVHDGLKKDVEALIAAGIIDKSGRYNWNASKTSLAEIFKTQFKKTPWGFWQTIACSFTCRGKPVTANQLKHLANKNGNGDAPAKSADFIRIWKILKLDRARRYLESVKQSGYKDSEKIYETLKVFFNEKVD